MDILQFDFTESLITQQEIDSFSRELIPEIKRVREAQSQGYETPYAALNAPFDTHILATVQDLVTAKKQLNPSTLVVIGIGGSNLGTIAVHEALHGRLYNDTQPSLKLYCVDTIDTDQLAALMAIVERELKQKRTIILNVISKSGTTTETIANFELFLSLLQRYHPQDFHQYVVVTTDEQSRFAAYAHQHTFSVLEIPRLIGGRYSVFSAVGLFPLGLLGVDLEALLAGARSMTQTGTHDVISQNPAALSAVLKYAYYQQCVNIHDLFIFIPDMASMGWWYRQLMGESIGKEFNRNNQRIEVGITPTVSIGSTDLHSVGQLYLGGPRDKFTTFVTAQQRTTATTLPVMPEFEPFVAHIQGKPITVLMNAIVQGVRAAYRNGKRPYCSIQLPDTSAHTMGQLFQFFMIEMIYLGYLFDVNPFDQPNVESYKKETRKILSHD